MAAGIGLIPVGTAGVETGPRPSGPPPIGTMDWTSEAAVQSQLLHSISDKLDKLLVTTKHFAIIQHQMKAIEYQLDRVSLLLLKPAEPSREATAAEVELAKESAKEAEKRAREEEDAWAKELGVNPDDPVDPEIAAAVMAQAAREVV